MRNWQIGLLEKKSLLFQISQYNFKEFSNNIFTLTTISN